MKLNRKIGIVCIVDVLACTIYLVRSTYMILGLITVVTLIVNLNCTKKIESILANRIEFISSILIGIMIFVIRTLFRINTKQIMIDIMSIVISFFLVSLYVVIRIILFY